MNLKVGLLTLSIVGLGLSAEARAQVPPKACQSEPNLSSFNAGVMSGRALVQQGWEGVGESCFQVEYFSSVLLDNVERLIAPAGSDSYVTCRHSGIVSGVYQEIGSVWDACAMESCDAGDFVGRLAGMLVCCVSAGVGVEDILDYLPTLPTTALPWVSQSCCEGSLRAEINQCVDAASIPWNPLRQYVCAPRRR